VLLIDGILIRQGKAAYTAVRLQKTFFNQYSRQENKKRERCCQQNFQCGVDRGFRVEHVKMGIKIGVGKIDRVTYQNVKAGKK
jgi:hypothetical protein